MVHQLDVENLLQELTLSEKISLLAGIDFWHTVPIDRLDVPSVRVSDGPNGIRGTKFFDSIPSNCFPCGTGLAATFNKELLHEAGALMGEEAILKGAHCVLGPTCNILRNPLGGRAFESYSEDPLLSGHAASEIIKGIQSTKVLACIKHFVANDQEDERRLVDTIVTERALREIYLKPFQIALRDSNPRALMTAYNKVNGEHASESKKLLQDTLRKEWGFDGLTMSDWYGTYSIKQSLDAGLNLEMPGPTRLRADIPTSHLVYSNEIHEDVIDENVGYVLRFINECLQVGIAADAPELPNESKESSQLLRKVGAESIVLLKNTANILPLNKSTKQTIAVIGPNAKAAQESGGGSASLNARYKITPYDGIKTKVEEGGNAITLDYSLGAFLDSNLPDVGPLLVNEKGNLGVTGKFYRNPPGSAERDLFETIDLPTSRIFMSDFKSKKLKPYENLFYADFEAEYTAEETGTFDFGASTFGTAQLFVDGELVVDNKTKQTKGDAFFLGMGTREERGTKKLVKGQTYKIKVEFTTGPSYTLSTENTEKGGVYFGFAINSTPEAEIAKAVEIAKSADKVVLCVGISKEWESEGFDRPNMDIPGYTNDLVSAVTKVNSNVIVVNQSGSALTFPWVDDVQAIVHAWYGGNELGNTIADVLFGDVNPSGKLSVTFPKRLLDCPAYLNFGSSHGRVLYGEDVFVGYRYYEKVDRDVLYPFGFGLSYTSFDFNKLSVSADAENVTVKVDVTNTGKTDGAETVQVYVEHVNPGVIRPVKELRDFGKVFVKAGHTKSVTLTFSVKEATSYWNEYKNKWHSEKGTYKVLVGNSSDNILQQGQFNTDSTLFWLGL